jgi:hypothetical protein
VTLLMKVTPMAPAYYMLLLSLVGLLLGIYLRNDLNSEAKPVLAAANTVSVRS